MGVEVSTTRLWQRAEELDLARMIFVNMLDRERADFFRTLDVAQGRLRPARRRDRDPDRRRARRPRRHRPRRHEGLRVRRRRRATTAREIPIPDDLQALAEEYREKLMDEVAEVSDALMERYLEGEEISHDEIVTALKDGTNHGGIFPVICGVATRNLAHQPAARRDRRGPARRRSSTARSSCPRSRSSPTSDARAVRLRLQDEGRPVRGRINLFRVYQGVDAPRHPRAQHARPQQGAHRPAARLAGQGDRPRRRVRARRHRRRRQAQGDARRRLAGRARRADRRCRRSSCPRRSWRSRSSPRPRATRTRSSPRCAACRRRTRRSTCTATRRPATRSSPGSRRSTSRSSSTA